MGKLPPTHGGTEAGGESDSPEGAQGTSSECEGCWLLVPELGPWGRARSPLSFPEADGWRRPSYHSEYLLSRWAQAQVGGSRGLEGSRRRMESQGDVREGLKGRWKEDTPGLRGDGLGAGKPEGLRPEEGLEANGAWRGGVER